MKQIKSWAQYYVDLMTKLGLVRFSMFLATAIIVLAVSIQMGVTLFLRGTVDIVDLVRSVFFGLLVTPWAVYFLSIVVDQLEDSRQRLTRMVRKLQDMRERDLELNSQLQENISRLNAQIAETNRAETLRQQAIEDLENEVFQREKAQLHLGERTALLRSFIDCSPDLVYYRNEDEQFSGCNRAMEELTGKVEAELIGLTPFDVYKHDIASKVVETDKQVFAQNEPLTYEQWLEYPDGRKAYFELRKVPFFDRFGKRLGLLGFGRDITERKQYQDKLEKASRDKTTFISTISHELRTPLNGILGYAQLLDEDQRLPEHVKHAVGVIKRGGDHLLSLVEGTLDIARIESGKLTLDLKPVRLDDLLRQITGLIEHEARAKHLRFVADIDPALPVAVRADERRVRQILINVLGNAVKFTTTGQVTFKVRYAREIAQVDITDTGPGIAQAELDKIFEPFARGSSAAGNAASGTGLGLTISKMLTDLMGGEMSVSSTPGQGTTFRIRLFLPQVRVAGGLLAAAPRGQRTGYVGDRRRIWVVDNEEADRGLLMRILEPLGFEVTPFASGLDCLAGLRVCPPTQLPHAVFMDLAMPGLDGWATLRAIRTEGLSQAPAAIVSANAFDKALENDVGIAPEDFIVKPVRVAELLDWLGRRLSLQWIETERGAGSMSTAGADISSAEVVSGDGVEASLPSIDALRTLEDQVHTGYMRGVHKVLDQIAAAEPQCEPFVQRLRGMARQFQLDAMAEVLSEALARREGEPAAGAPPEQAQSGS